MQPAGGRSNIVFGEEPVVKTAKKIHDQKFHELTGNNIFKEDAPPGPEHGEIEGDEWQQHLRRRKGRFPGLLWWRPKASWWREQHCVGLGSHLISL